MTSQVTWRAIRSTAKTRQIERGAARPDFFYVDCWRELIPRGRLYTDGFRRWTQDTSIAWPRRCYDTRWRHQPGQISNRCGRTLRLFYTAKCWRVLDAKIFNATLTLYPTVNSMMDRSVLMTGCIYTGIAICMHVSSSRLHYTLWRIIYILAERLPSSHNTSTILRRQRLWLDHLTLHRACVETGRRRFGPITTLDGPWGVRCSDRPEAIGGSLPYRWWHWHGSDGMHLCGPHAYARCPVLRACLADFRQHLVCYALTAAYTQAYVLGLQYQHQFQALCYLYSMSTTVAFSISLPLCEVNILFAI